MNEQEVRRWMMEHPESIHGAPESIISRCTRDLRRRGSEAAWIHAKSIVDHEHHTWEGRHGNHASPGFVAREVCRSLAAKLRKMEPAVADGAEDRALDPETREALEGEAIARIRPWLHDVMAGEEHQEWLRIVEFTKAHAVTIAEEAYLSASPDWQSSREYGESAELVTRILSQEMARHIR